MDKTLREYLAEADRAHNHVLKYGIAMSINQLEDQITHLHKSTQQLQSIAKRIADVANIINHHRIIKKSIVGGPITELPVNPFPTENSHAIMRRLYSTQHTNIIPGINVSAITVKSLSHIPVSNLYYVEDIGQFAVNVNGVNIRGTIGDIVNGLEVHTKEAIARCQWGAECKNLNTSCKYYHDPEHFIKRKLPIPENNRRNFTVGSWLHTKSPSNKSRHIGGRQSLLIDLCLLKKTHYLEEILTREDQLIHDLLIYMVLNEKNMLERYKV